MKWVGLILVIVAIAVLAPLPYIWALNTLFRLGIPYTFWTWLATALLILPLVGSRTSSKD